MLSSPAIRLLWLSVCLCTFLSLGQAQEYSVGAGEIRFDGTLVSHDATGNSLVLSVTSFTLSNGKSSKLVIVKSKTVLVSPATVYLVNSDTATKVAPSLVAGMPITVIGKDVGSGKDFSARLVAWKEEPSTPGATNILDDKEVKLKAGETRFEGKLTGIFTETNLTVSVFTKATAGGEKTDVFPLESKTVLMDENTILRSRGDANRKLKFEDLKIGERVTFAGKVSGDKVKAREIAIWEADNSSSEDVGSVSISGAVSALIDQADAAYEAKAYEEAIKILNRAMQAADGADDRAGRGLALDRLGNAYGEINQVQKAVSAFEGALTVWRSMNNEEMESSTLNNLGLLLGNSDQLEKAVPILEKAVQLGRGHDPRGLSLSLLNLASAYTEQKKYDKTLEVLLEALPLVRQNKKFDNTAVLISRIARFYAILGKPQQALEYAEQAEPLLADMQDKSYQAIANYYVGSAYLSANRNAKGLEFYQRALAIYTELGSKEDVEGLKEEIAAIEKPA